MWIGDGIAFLGALTALIYGIVIFLRKKVALYFQLICAAIFCYVLGYLYGVCQYITMGALSEGFSVGYLGTIGCFLFLMTANYTYIDGILDDGTKEAKKSRYIALIAPLLVIALFIPNALSDAHLGAKIGYTLVWIVACFSSYYNLKHATIPDMDFGFAKAIRPFNISALVFTLLQLVHWTVWNVGETHHNIISGSALGISCVVMMVFANKGVKKWIL